MKPFELSLTITFLTVNQIISIASEAEKKAPTLTISTTTATTDRWERKKNEKKKRNHKSLVVVKQIYSIQTLLLDKLCK